jgi:hypothetical protein
MHQFAIFGVFSISGSNAEAVMKPIILAALAVTAMSCLASQPAQAYYHGRWCAVFSLGHDNGAERCDFRDFESCRMEIIAGNRGFCRPNAYWSGQPEPAPRRQRRRR